MTAEQTLGFANLPQTVPHLMFAALRRFNKPNAVSYKDKNSWVNIAAEKFIESVKTTALGLAEMGIRAGDRVAIISENRPEWSITDLAILSLRAINVPIYTTQAHDQIRYILEDSNSKILFVSNKKTFQHAAPGVEGVESIERIVFFDDDAIPADYSGSSRAISLDSIEQRGGALDRADREAFDRFLGEVKADDLATIIYTSGTTGEPKGVMLAHENFASNIQAVSKALPITEADRALSVLPLSHIFERTCFYILCCNGVAMSYCASFEHLAQFLTEVRPTIMPAVPRLFEQVYHKIVRKGMAAGGWKTKLFAWALENGQKYAEAQDKGKFISPILRMKQAVANRLVFSKWREGVGGSMRFFVSGGAPLSAKLSYAFWGAGIPILQGYGTTEVCTVTINRPENHKVGSIGIPFEGIEVKIAAEDGEILVRGKNVMRGYYNKPELTAEVMTEDGFYRTGDVGEQRADGHFYITDRKKDLFKLSNGKYIAPQQLETLLKQAAFVSQAVVLGSGRKQTAALIVPDFEALKAFLQDKNIDTRRSREELCRDPRIIKLVQREMGELTSERADYERVKKVVLLPREFSIERGEMTATLKTRRGKIEENYRELLDEVYGSSD